MKKNIILIVFLLLAAAMPAARGQAVDSFLARAARFPAEVVYLHCNKYRFAAGDTVWWKEYVTEVGEPSVKSTNLYVELFSPTGGLVQRSIFPVDLAIGQMGLPDTLAPGIYWVRAYTRYQLNFDTAQLFEVPILVHSRKAKREERVRMAMPPLGPYIGRIGGLLTVATVGDSSLRCHLEADEDCPWVGKGLDLVVERYRQPMLKASFALSPGKRWQDLGLRTGGIRGPVELLLFCGDSLLGSLSVNLGLLSSPEVVVSADTLRTLPGAYNSWSVRIKDERLFNCSVSVSDADETTEEPRTIQQALSADGFPGSPQVIQADTDFLTFTGSVRTKEGALVRNGELVAMMARDTGMGGRPLVLPLDTGGCFKITGRIFMDTAWMSYEMNSFENDARAKAVTVSLVAPSFPRFVSPDTSLWRDSMVIRNEDEEVDTIIPAGSLVKELPRVTVRGDANKELDDRYAIGIFTKPTLYSFDLRNDKSESSIWAFLRKNVPGFQGGPDVGQMPTWDQRPVLFYVNNRAQTLVDLENYWYEEIAYVKAYSSLMVNRTLFEEWAAGIDQYAMRLDSATVYHGRISLEPPVISLFTRKGNDTKTGWLSLPRVSLVGYSPVVHRSVPVTDPGMLYWQPLAVGNRFRVHFYNRKAERFRVCIEGMAQDGMVVHYETVIVSPDVSKGQK